MKYTCPYCGTPVSADRAGKGKIFCTRTHSTHFQKEYGRPALRVLTSLISPVDSGWTSDRKLETAGHVKGDIRLSDLPAPALAALQLSVEQREEALLSIDVSAHETIDDLVNAVRAAESDRVHALASEGLDPYSHLRINDEAESGQDPRKT